MSAAMEIALESGGRAVRVSAVAERAGLSRTSIYEYFGSSAELISDLMIDELDSFATELQSLVLASGSPLEAIEAWIRGSLAYVADGRHLLAKALNSVEISPSRSRQIGMAHRNLLSPLRQSLSDLGVEDIDLALSFIKGISDSALPKIENTHDANAVIDSTTAFCIAGISAMRTS